ncbi:MAG: phosphate acetyltransferase [Rubellimicrobium sp.]|nr:phosphate acetyltransferase [Rubellimicrobium sp.]
MTAIYPFLSPLAPTCPQALLARARRFPPPRVALVNAGGATALEGIREAAEQGLARPVLVGDPGKIARAAEEIGWDITPFPLIDAPGDAASPAAAALARDGAVDSIMKGQVHTSTFLKGLLPSSAGLRRKGDICGHVFHITMPGADRPLLLTDGALNTAPDIPTRQACLAHAVALARALGIDCPKAGLLAASEDVTPGIPSTGEAAVIAAWARTALPGTVVEGPMALDLILSREAALTKGYVSEVSGDADIILVPEVTTGNAIFKLMSLGMGACAGGLVMGASVPLLLTSRSQTAADRIASAALGMIAAAMARGEA